MSLGATALPFSAMLSPIRCFKTLSTPLQKFLREKLGAWAGILKRVVQADGCFSTATIEEVKRWNGQVSMAVPAFMADTTLYPLVHTST